MYVTRFSIRSNGKAQYVLTCLPKGLCIGECHEEYGLKTVVTTEGWSVLEWLHRRSLLPSRPHLRLLVTKVTEAGRAMGSQSSVL